MTVTYGFYDSLAGDRVYNAEQMSSIFDGIIADGIFQSIGSVFGVVDGATGMEIIVSSGRAWFNHTWTLNDSDLILVVPDADLVLNRIDTVVIEVNADASVRENAIKIISGTPASTPVAPTLTNAGTLHQYPLADIYVGAGVTTISGGNITNRIGIDTPFSTGILETINIESLFTEWDGQFSDWFNNLVDQLTGEQVTNLQNQIDQFVSLGSYKIVPSVNSGNLTVALKDLYGGDYSSANPLRIKIGDEKAIITGPLSITKNAGTNWMRLGSPELASFEVDLFVYLISETGASSGIKLGFSRISHGSVVGNFSSTPTEEKYLAGPTNYNATDKVENIGRINVILSGGAGYTWSLPAMSFVVNTPSKETRILNWLPVWTNLTVGNAIQASKYRILPFTVQLRVDLIFGSTTVISGGVTSTLPFDPTDDFPNPAGVAIFRDLGTTQYQGAILVNNGRIARYYCLNSAGSFASQQTINITAPHAWAVNDEIVVDGGYFSI